MAECHLHKKSNMYPNLSVMQSNEKQFRLNKINEIKDYFVAEIEEREIMTERLSKYITFLTILISH